MIERIFEWSIQRSAWVLSVALVVGIWGAVAFWRTPIDAIPDLSENQQLVYADWPGHGPREIDEQVTRPLSMHLQGIPGVRTIRGASEVDFSLIHLVFDESVSYRPARQRVAERLTTAMLPAGVVARLGPDGLATGQIFWYTVEGPGHDLGQLRAIQDSYVKPALASVAGVAEVASVGGFVAEYQVEVDPHRLAARGVEWKDIVETVRRAQATTGGGVLHKQGAEFVIRIQAALGASATTEDSREAAILADLERLQVPTRYGAECRIGDIASVQLGGKPRRGALEKDGNEVVGGVVLMRYGENPREVTGRLRDRITQLAPGLPAGVSILPCYDRTPLIDGAVWMAGRTVLEAMLTAGLAVLLVLRHLRAATVIAMTPVLAALAAFAALELLRAIGLVNIETNIMSLAGIAVSVGVLVDSAIVVVENVMTRVRDRFGEQAAAGDIRAEVSAAAREVGRPIFGSVALMLLSFLPVFALGGLAGRMFFPLAATKSLVLAAVAVLAITVVPAMCVHLVKGRLRRETDSWLVRGVMDVYRPTLDWLIDNPAFIVMLVTLTLLVATVPTGVALLFKAVLFTTLLLALVLPGCWRGRLWAAALTLAVGLSAERWMAPLGVEFLAPLDEGTVMDMPITVPRASITQSVDDLKARDMILCRFPEVSMVVGKSGRADTPTDPAPLDMIETMVDFHPQATWPARAIERQDALKAARTVYDQLAAEKLIDATGGTPDADTLDAVVEAVLVLFDAQMRECAYQRQQELNRESPRVPHAWRVELRQLNHDLQERGSELLVRLLIEEWISQQPSRQPEGAAVASTILRIRRARQTSAGQPQRGGHHGLPAGPLPAILSIDPVPAIASVQQQAAKVVSTWLRPRPRTRDELVGSGGELDRAVPMPGWVNVWTMPIQNRVDMLATGVNAAVGVRILGDDLNTLVQIGDQIAAVVKRVSGAADVIADPVRGKGYLEIDVDQTRAARLGLNAGELAETAGQSLGGVLATNVREGTATRDVRVRMNRSARTDEASVADLPIAFHGRQPVLFRDVADVRIAEGPASIKSENGLLRHYVRFQTRGRPASAVVADARRAVAEQIQVAPGIQIEWTGQFEHAEKARRTLTWMTPVVVLLILLVLYWTYRDWADAFLILLAVPGALAGGVLVQWLAGYSFSVTVWVGYVACFGMATATGVIMVVYLRSAVERAAEMSGGFQNLTAPVLRRAVLDGAAHRLRPKLLTEATTILGLAPLLWATGVGSEVIRPMAAPVLGGVLVADEVIDLLLPVLFFHLRKSRLDTARHEPVEGERL